MRRFIGRYLWEILLLTIIGGLFTIWLTSCGPRQTPPVSIAPPTALEDPSRIESAEAKEARLTGELAAVRAEVKNARLAGVRTLVTWLTAICVLVGILSVGAFVFWRMASLLVLTGACAGMVAAAQATTALLNHPALAGVALLVVVIGALAVVWLRQRHTQNGLAAAVRFGIDMTKADTNDEAEIVKQRHATEQVRCGIHDLICKTIARVKRDKTTA